jgi:DNA-binding FadR family transcriptional regulator
MGQLDDHTWRRAIELFLVAGDYNQEGNLPPLEKIAWELHTTPDDVRQALLRLEGLKVVSSFDRENWAITNFAKRQKAVTGAERSRRYRLRQSSPLDGYG